MYLCLYACELISHIESPGHVRTCVLCVCICVFGETRGGGGGGVYLSIYLSVYIQIGLYVYTCVCVHMRVWVGREKGRERGGSTCIFVWLCINKYA